MARLLLHAALLHQWLLCLAAAASLYKATDPILQLDVTTFNESVYDADSAFLVEFYSSWCGHCQHFAPKYGAFARDVLGWSDVARVSAVNCADEQNTDLCREHGIDGYPMIKYFPHRTWDANSSRLVSEGERDGAELQLPFQLADCVQADWRRQAVKGWPDFSNVSDSSPLTELVGGDVGAVLLLVVVQTRPAFGYALTLDFHKEHRVSVALISTSHRHINVSTLGAKPNTYVALFDTRDLTKPLTTSASSDTASVRQELKRHVAALLLGDAESRHRAIPQEIGGPATSTTGEPSTTLPLVNKYEVHWRDVRSGLAYMLRQEISLKQTIKGDDFDALGEFMKNLAEYLPASPPVRRLLTQLRLWLDAADRAAGIAGADFEKRVDQLQESLGHPLPANITWASCRGSQPQYRGYPCSLWTIFHLVTVNAYKAARADASLHMRPKEVLHAIGGYVHRYFGCSECADNFGEMAAHIDEDVRQLDDVVLWLWRAHNNANRRLRIDASSSDPAYPKEQFPTYDQCPECRVDSSVPDEAPLVAIEANWRVDKVLPFLIEFYDDIKFDDKQMQYQVSSFDGVKDDRPAARRRYVDSLSLNPKFEKRLDADVAAEERLAMQRRGDREAGQGGYGAGGKQVLGSDDWSLCFTVWLFSILLVGGICLFINYRSRRNMLKRFHPENRGLYTEHKYYS